VLNSKDASKVVIPVEETLPTTGSATYSGKLFADVLGTFSTSNIGATGSPRAFNIIYAASLLNGHIILPGETFSFNAVANNSAANSVFKMAAAYQDGQIVQSPGGGICQVSSTMYNSVLLADLQVVTRKNHSFMVGYVPLGRDATVSAGSQDFKFKNNTSMPIRLETSAGGGSIKIAITGTNEHPGKTVVLTSNKYNMVPGNKMNGWTADAFKSIYQDGKLVSTVKISTSVYKPMIVAQPAQTPVPQQTPQPSQSPQPVQTSQPTQAPTPIHSNTPG
jgi:vancomycin resistance protein YoaR